MSKTAQMTLPSIPEPASRAITPMDMLDKALASGAGPEVLEKFMALHERWEANQARGAYNEAISLAKATIKPIARTKLGHNNKKHVDMAVIAREVDPVLAEHGLSYRYHAKQDEKIHVTCVLSHRDGYSEETTLSGPPDTTGNKNAIQAIGSTTTYLQRYTLMLALGLSATDDDDGLGGATGDGEVITEAQAKVLLAAIDEAGSSAAAICKKCNVAAIPAIPAGMYDRVMVYLERKRAGLKDA